MFPSCAARCRNRSGRSPKHFSIELANRNPKLITAEYRVAKRPESHVLVDYNQNAWNRTLASVYSVRPKPAATVSTPVTWEEVERGLRMEDFTMKTVPPARRKSAICGSRCWTERPHESGSSFYDASAHQNLCADGSAARTRSASGPDWQYEPKWDGFRCLAFRDGDHIDLESKSGKPLTRYFPEFVGALSA